MTEPAFTKDDIEDMRLDFETMALAVEFDPRFETTEAARRVLRHVGETFDEVPDTTILALWMMNEHTEGEILAAVKIRLMQMAVGTAPHIEDALSLVAEFVPLLDNFRPGLKSKAA